MKNAIAALVLLFLVCIPALAKNPPGTWILDPSVSDEFNGGSLDTSKWHSGPLWYASTGEGWPFKPENGFVANGMLHLRAVPGTKISVAAVHSTFLIPANSYMEIRAKCLPWAAKILTGIWLAGPYEAQYDPNPEIDIQEVFSPTRIESHLWLWNSVNDQEIGGGRGREHPVDVGVDVTADFHLYGLERRSPDIVRIYFDDKLVWDAKEPNQKRHAEMERWVIFSLESHLQSIPQKGGYKVDMSALPAEALVDYVRVYRLDTSKKQ